MCLPSAFLRVQFDKVPAIRSLGHPIETIVRWYEENVLREPINAVARRGENVYLFFDELENLPQWSGQLKALVDATSARTLVTGSSALRIVRQRDGLAGRLTEIGLGPLRVWEIARIRSLGELPPFAPEADLADWMNLQFWVELGSHAQKHAKALKQAFLEFSNLGGYPRCHKPGDASVGLLSRQITETVVDRTIDYDPLIGRGCKRRNER